MSTRQCRVQRVAIDLPEQELLMLTALAEGPRCITQDRGWSEEKMRDLCGIYNRAPRQHPAPVASRSPH